MAPTTRRKSTSTSKRQVKIKIPLYKLSDKVLCKFNGQLYDAIILEIKHADLFEKDENMKKSSVVKVEGKEDTSDDDDIPTLRTMSDEEGTENYPDNYAYFLHYKNWNSNWDEWVRSDCLLPISVESREKQRDLKLNARKEKLSKKYPKKKRRRYRRKNILSQSQNGEGDSDDTQGTMDNASQAIMDDESQAIVDNESQALVDTESQATVDNESQAMDNENQPMDNSGSQVIDNESRAMNSESRAMNSESHAMNSESRAMNSESHAMNSESHAMNSESHAMNSESHAMNSESQPMSNSESQAMDNIESQAMDNSESKAMDNSESKAMDNSESKAMDSESKAMDSDSPAMDSDGPAMDSDGAAMDNKGPAIDNASQTMGNAAHAMGNKAPAMDIEGPATDNGNRTMDNEGPTTGIESQTVDPSAVENEGLEGYQSMHDEHSTLKDGNETVNEFLMELSNHLSSIDTIGAVLASAFVEKLGSSFESYYRIVVSPTHSNEKENCVKLALGGETICGTVHFTELSKMIDLLGSGRWPIQGITMSSEKISDELEDLEIMSTVCKEYICATKEFLQSERFGRGTRKEDIKA